MDASQHGGNYVKAVFASMLGDAVFTGDELLFPCGLRDCSSVKFWRADSGSDAADDNDLYIED